MGPMLPLYLDCALLIAHLASNWGKDELNIVLYGKCSGHLNTELMILGGADVDC
jgi:hypothetical protein